MRVARNTLILCTAHLLASCAPVAHYPGVPAVYGDVKSLSETEVRAALAAYTKFVRGRPPIPKGSGMPIVGDPITFIRVIDSNKLQIHYWEHNSLSQRWVDVDRHGSGWEVGYGGLQTSEQDF
jgi:hypothetical protein